MHEAAGTCRFQHVSFASLAIGDVVEFEATDPKGEVSKAILVIENLGPADRYYMGHFVAASEKGYTDWMFKKDGHPVPGLYKIYANKGDDKDKKLGKEKVDHILKYRVLVTGQEPICLAPCKSARVTGTMYMAVERLRRGELNSALFSKTATRKQTTVNIVYTTLTAPIIQLKTSHLSS
jgi:hypothetical protein